MKSVLLILLILFFLFLFPRFVKGHDGGISGRVVSALDEQPIHTVLLVLQELQDSTYSNANGRFEFRSLPPGEYHLLAIRDGYESSSNFISITTDTIPFFLIRMEEKALQLKEVIISADRDFTTTTRSRLDRQLRPINSSQDYLRLVPGLFIAQHAGGGKAEQIFLRGFDIDHGTDLNLQVDGVPVNMVSHAHGQGYADLHFVIPETVDKINIALGPYRSDVGNLMTAGAIGLDTYKSLSENQLKVEGGMYQNARVMIKSSLINRKDQSVYVASEYLMNQGYFDNPQDFSRFNAFAKYFGKLSSLVNLELSASAFQSDWNASGQIPERAVAQHEISRFGSIDNTEGGKTSRSNLNLILSYQINPKCLLKVQTYYTHYTFNLYSNFTFFLRDSINGDQILQSEKRSLTGYHVSLLKTGKLGTMNLKTLLGSSLRYDAVGDNQLAATTKRIYLSPLNKGRINETNASFFAEATLSITPTISMVNGVRYDHFVFEYASKLDAQETALVQKGILNPKILFYYTPTSRVQFFAKAGSGFHSNDARVVVQNQAQRTLPRAIGTDLGISGKISPNTILTSSVWLLFSQNEFVYVGDEGIVEVNGRTQRTGIDVSLRSHLLNWLYADLDVNATTPRYRDNPDKQNYIPLAPVFSSIGGLKVKLQNGFSASLRYRYLADRPANEDRSLLAKGYFLQDIIIRFARKQIEIFTSIENLFNRPWNEAQFDTASRLQNEANPTSEIHFTPGTPFFLKSGISYQF